VLACAALGQTNAEIAAELNLREGTVKSYLQAAMAKLDASTRHAAVTGAPRGPPLTRMSRRACAYRAGPCAHQAQPMARKIVHQLVDDLDGTVLEPGEGETVLFSLDGAAYEIDLTDDNAAALRAAFALSLRRPVGVFSLRARRLVARRCGPRAAQRTARLRAGPRVGGEERLHRVGPRARAGCRPRGLRRRALIDRPLGRTAVLRIHLSGHTTQLRHRELAAKEPAMRRRPHRLVLAAAAVALLTTGCVAQAPSPSDEAGASASTPAVVAPAGADGYGLPAGTGAVEIQLFTDLSCPYCRMLEEATGDVLEAVAAAPRPDDPPAQLRECEARR
jgi:hypothetical protein